MNQFIRILLTRDMISIEGDIEKPGYVFGSLIPIGGTRKRLTKGNVLLIGDAAGFCGAFAADGIKGSVVSGKEAAPLIERFLNGEERSLSHLSKCMDPHGGLMDYYRRQVRYRWIWDRMRRDRTFRAMYDVIAVEKETFLEQFCDSKDKQRGLSRTVLKRKNLGNLVRYVSYLAYDTAIPPQKKTPLG
ncbi:MAG TPA: hypothetical protein VJB99_03300 [Patescibacteria group bacterium]|nr:hypothetical protein [Patescibacteria group bacterium]